jgi:hypothetical protein
MDLNSIRYFSTGLVIVGSLIIISLERIFPYKKGQKFFREGSFEDFVLYTLFQSYAMEF